MKTKKLNFLFLFACFLLSSCNNADEEIKKWPDKGDYYDSSKEVAFSSITPDWGRINDNFIIKGNFPSDTSKIKVFFGDKKAVLVSCDGRELYGLIPKQKPGFNKITVEVDGQPYESESAKFKYYQTQSVKSVVGKLNDWSGSWKDQSLLDETKIEYSSNLVAVGGKKQDNLIFVVGGWNDRTYFVSFDDNMVMRLINVGYMGSIAVDNSRNKIALMPRNGGAIYTATREDGWTLNSIGLSVPFQGDSQGALTYAEDNNLLYCMSGDGLYEINISDKSYKKVINKGDFPAFNGLNTGQWRHYLTYSKFDKCFFASYPDDNGILKLWKDSDNKWQVERYAGFKPGWMASAFGDRLNDAVLKQPCGMAVNSYGELYVALRNAHCIVKIKGRLVTLVAGTPDRSGKVNGFPTDCFFDCPLAIAIDSEENFFIGEENSRAIRKMTIE